MTGPTPGPALAQHLLPAANEYRAPDVNVLPDHDNNVHSDMNWEASAQDQVIHLVLEGEIVQFCDGTCDPD